MTGWNLMENNVSKEDIDNLIEWLKTYPFLTNGKKVIEFEEKWSKWLGVKYSVMVNSGSSANFLSVMALHYRLKKEEKRGKYDEIMVAPLNWISDIAAIKSMGFHPRFIDINPKNLCIDNDKIIEEWDGDTKAIMLTHLAGFNGLTERLYDHCQKNDIAIIEDVCESHGTLTFDGTKCGTKGLMSCFSFYYGHHMTTIEGGMVCTNDEELYQILRMLRSHGLVRECTNQTIKDGYKLEHLEHKEGFVFAYPGYNMRSTEINAVMGIKQLDTLDEKIKIRQHNFKTFLANLDTNKYRVDFDVEGNSNFGLIIILKEQFKHNIDKVCAILKENNFMIRKGLVSGNHVRQPYLEGCDDPTRFPNTEYIHFHSVYVGNYHGLNDSNISFLCNLLNRIK